MKPRLSIATLSAMAALAAGTGCHVLPTRLPERPIDDPVTLPSRMARVAVFWGPRFPDPGAPGKWPIDGSVAIGLTPRLQLNLPLSLSYAVLEERPSDGRPAQPMTLAVGGGFQTIGFGGPVSGAFLGGQLLAKKRLGRRWRLDASFSVEAPTRFGPRAGTVGHGLSGELGATLQIGNRWTVAGSVDGGADNERPLFVHEAGFLSGADGHRWVALPLTLRWRVCPGFDALVSAWETLQHTYYDPEFGAPLATPRGPSSARITALEIGVVFRW